MSDRAWVISCLRRRSRRRFSCTSHDRPACFNAEITVRGEELLWPALQNARMVGGVHVTATPPASSTAALHPQGRRPHWLDAVTTAVTSGTYTDPRRSRITVSDWSARWLATKVDLKALLDAVMTACCGCISFPAGARSSSPTSPMSRSPPGLLSCVAAGCRRRPCGRSTACSRSCSRWPCVTGASRAIRQTACRYRGPARGAGVPHARSARRAGRCGGGSGS